LSLTLSLLRPRSSLFPYTTLFRSPLHSLECAHDGRLQVRLEELLDEVSEDLRVGLGREDVSALLQRSAQCGGVLDDAIVHHGEIDRKSTRLNSSHVKISYAVFCLK